LDCSPLDVVPPTAVPEFLASQQWEAEGYGLVLHVVEGRGYQEAAL
jgi:hypothetical protein